MRTVVGIFGSRGDAESAVSALCALRIGDDRIIVLTPGRHDIAAAVPTDEAEQPGTGAAIGAVVGGAVGAAAAMPLGAAVASFFIPGVGPVIALGLAGAALLGAGGAAVGTAIENALTHGVPKDEVFVYEDALRRGRTVLVALTDDEKQAEAARAALVRAGAESLDAAREQWWIGLRSAERERYVGGAVAFDRAEPSFRRGFEAALRVGLRGRTYAEAQAELRDLYPELYANEAFREGYERGSAYYSGLARSEREAA
jgi:hypothetical protein